MEIEVIQSRRRTMAIEVRPDRIIVRVPLKTTRMEVGAFLERNRAWIEKHTEKVLRQKNEMDAVRKLTREELLSLMEQAKKVIPERVRYFSTMVGVNVGRITIRAQHTKWGSCSAKGNLNFNCLLMLAPPEVLDSVVVHELCHRWEMNHSERFYQHVLRVFPNYRECDRWLKKNGKYLMSMLPE